MKPRSLVINHSKLKLQLKYFPMQADVPGVIEQKMRNVFCLYLWRSPETPGAVYLADSLQSAQAIYSGLLDLGYIVRAMQLGSNLLYGLEGGELKPLGPYPAEDNRLPLTN